MKWSIPHAVVCPFCNAASGEWCISDGGRSRKPHSQRIARAQGLKSTPMSGSYVRPVPQSKMDFSDVELAALATLLDEFQYERVTGRSKP